MTATAPRSTGDQPRHRFDQQQMAIAGVYAEALLGLAEERGSAVETAAELEAIAAMFTGDAQLGAFLSSPLVTADARKSALERAFRGRASDLVTNTLHVVLEKGRIDLLPAILEAYRTGFARRTGQLDVGVRSAVALSVAARGRLTKAIAALTGKTPRLEEVVDPALLGGLVITFDDQKFDSSVAAQLRRLESALMDRASGEIVRWNEEAATRSAPDRPTTQSTSGSTP